MKEKLENLRDALETNAAVDWDVNNPASEFEALAKLVQDMIDDIPDPALKKAYEYLIDNGNGNELTVPEQLEALRNHPEGNDYACSIEGVLVWQPFEDYTVEMLLDLIE
jgi:hypothetical protein